MQNAYCWSELKLSWLCVSLTLQYLKHDLTKRNWSQADFGCDWPRPLEQVLSFDHICTVHLRQLHHHHKNLLFCFQQALNQPTCQDIDDDVAARRVVVCSLASTPHRAEHFRTRTPAGSISPTNKNQHQPNPANKGPIRKTPPTPQPSVDQVYPPPPSQVNLHPIQICITRGCNPCNAKRRLPPTPWAPPTPVPPRSRLTNQAQRQKQSWKLCIRWLLKMYLSFHCTLSHFWPFSWISDHFLEVLDGRTTWSSKTFLFLSCMSCTFLSHNQQKKTESDNLSKNKTSPIFPILWQPTQATGLKIWKELCNLCCGLLKY